MTKPKAIVVGASAGGVDALQRLVRGLPGDFPVPLFIVLHISPEGSVLPQILTRAGRLPARHPEDREKIEPGRIYVAPPDFHMSVHDGYIRLTRGPKENRLRPAIDPLFRSAAEAYGAGTIGVILTGLLDDGTAGLRALKRLGGTAIVQDPKDALYTGMPLSAIEHVAVDHVLPLADIPPILTVLANEGAEPSLSAEDAETPMESNAFAEFDITTIRKEPDGTPASFSCPDCHGTLWEKKDGDLLTFRCRTGHSFTPAYLIAGQAEASENSLWDTLRALEEQAALFRYLAVRGAERKLSENSIDQFLKRAEEKDQAAAAIRELLLANKKSVTDAS